MEWEKLARFRAECFLKKEEPLAAEGQNICAKIDPKRVRCGVCSFGKKGCCGRKTLQANLRPRKRGRQNGWKAREATKGDSVSKSFHSKSHTAKIKGKRPRRRTVETIRRKEQGAKTWVLNFRGTNPRAESPQGKGSQVRKLEARQLCRSKRAREKHR